ncbi:hypothetical protein D3C78_679930 [compost metagenome]
MLRLPGQQLHLLLGLIQLLHRMLATAACLCHLAVGVLDVARYLVGRAGHLGHGGGHLLGLGILLVDVEEGLMGRVLQVGRQGLQGMGGVVDPTQHGTNAGLQHLEMEIGDGAGGIPRVDQPGQAVILLAEPLEVAWQRDELAPVSAGDGQQGQQHQQHRQGPLGEGRPAKEHQHQQAEQQGSGTVQGGQLAGAALFGLEQGLIGLGGDLLELGFGLAAHRLVAAYLAVLVDGGHIGVDPVIAAILAAVLDHATPGVALLEAIPEVGEGGLGHVGVTHQVVVVSDQFIDMVAGDAAEGGVGVGDDAAQIRGGDELHVGGELNFTVLDLDVFAGHKDKLRCVAGCYCG